MVAGEIESERGEREKKRKQNRAATTLLIMKNKLVPQNVLSQSAHN